MKSGSKLLLAILLVSIIIISGCAQQDSKQPAEQKKTVKAITKLTITSKCIYHPKPCDSPADLTITVQPTTGSSSPATDRFILALDQGDGTRITTITIGTTVIDVANNPLVKNDTILVCINNAKDCDGVQIALAEGQDLVIATTAIDTTTNTPTTATNTIPLATLASPAIPPGYTAIPSPDIQKSPSTESPDATVVLIPPATPSSQALPPVTSNCTVNYDPPKDQWQYGPCQNGQQSLLTTVKYNYTTNCDVASITPPKTKPCGDAVATQSPITSPTSTSQTLPTSSPTSTASPSATASPTPTSSSCTPNWGCLSWSSCSCETNTKTRTCTDSNNCGTITGKPAESESCDPRGYSVSGSFDQPNAESISSGQTKAFTLQSNQNKYYVFTMPSTSSYTATLTVSGGTLTSTMDIFQKYTGPLLTTSETWTAPWTTRKTTFSGGPSMACSDQQQVLIRVGGSVNTESLSLVVSSGTG